MMRQLESSVGPLLPHCLTACLPAWVESVSVSVARRRPCGASSGQTTSVPGSVRVKDKQGKGHVKCTTDSLAVLATSLQRRRRATSCNVQRATCNAPTVAAKYFYLYFIAPVEQLQFICPVLALASPAGQTQSASVLRQLLPPPSLPPSPHAPPLALLCYPLWCPARCSLCIFFYIITSTWAWAACLPWP